MTGIRMSIRTTSGGDRGRRRATSAPSAASPTTSMSSAPRSIIFSPDPDQGVVVGQQHADRTASCGHGSRARRAKCRRRWGRVERVPPSSGPRSAQAGQAGTGARTGAPARPGHDGSAVAGDLDGEAGPGRRGEPSPDGCARSVLAGVGQALLDDPVDGAAGRFWQLLAGVGQVDAGIQGDAPADRDSWSRSASWPKPGWGGPSAAAESSRSTVMTWRRSPSAAVAEDLITAAAWAISAAGESGRNSSAPACTLSSDSRWASTSCISRAMRRRSASRACSAARCWSAASRSAHSRSETNRSRGGRAGTGPSRTR